MKHEYLHRTLVYLSMKSLSFLPYSMIYDLKENAKEKDIKLHYCILFNTAHCSGVWIGTP